MPQKGLVASLGKKVEKFEKELGEVENFVGKIEGYKKITDKHKCWCYEQGIIRVYRAFEVLMLDCLVALLNKDASHLQEVAGIKLSKDFHLSQGASWFVVTQGDYFKFGNHDDFIDKKCKRFLPNNHPLRKALQKKRDAIDKMTALRNLSTHDSHKAKAQVKRALQQNPGNPGNRLRGGRNDRGERLMQELINDFKELATDIRKIAR